MDWRKLLADVNLIWTTMGLAVAGLSTAFGAGYWVGRRSLKERLRLLDEYSVALGDEKAKNASLQEKLAKCAALDQIPATLAPRTLSLPPTTVQVWMRAPSTADQELLRLPATLPVLVVANLKGGVAKTMTAANLAAYFAVSGEYQIPAHQRRERVLLIDLDYQGSMSGMAMNAMGVREASLPQKSQAQTLFTASISDEDALQFRVPQSDTFKRVSLYPASYGFDDFETRELLGWLLEETGNDVRFSLLRRLRSASFTSSFDRVIIDTGPRFSLGTIAALAAATHVLVPTTPDIRAVEAAQRFMERLVVLKSGLSEGGADAIAPQAKLLGILQTLVSGHGAHTANAARKTLESYIAERPRLRALLPDGPAVLASTLPLSQPIVSQAQQSVPYLVEGQTRRIINGIGLEVAQRMA